MTKKELMKAITIEDNVITIEDIDLSKITIITKEDIGGNLDTQNIGGSNNQGDIGGNNNQRNIYGNNTQWYIGGDNYQLQKGK